MGVFIKKLSKNNQLLWRCKKPFTFGIYVNPKKTNEILSGTTSVKIDELFQIAKTFLI